MKVLFAVNDEKSSAAIVKKYQKEYKEIISYKKVYYFNAILKELQRDKTYDRIVISEDLEEFSSTSYEQQDKYIFERLDNISDEASNAKGREVPIIVICSERRTKSEELLVKLFGIGIYNAIIGNDRSVDQVCRLLNKPRSKKEAKLYYKIDAEDVRYQTESENEVSEDEMQNILNHFSRLGKNEDRYVESFNNIVGQYNESQLRTIIAILPSNVKAILEESSIEYQKLVMNGKVSRVKRISNSPKSGPSEKLLNFNSSGIDVKRNPIIVPTALSQNVVTKGANKQNMMDLQNIDDDFEDEIDEIDDIDENIENNDNLIMEEINDTEETVVEEPPKRKRGRPRKNPVVEEVKPAQPRKRGRPRKVVENSEDATLPGFEDVDNNVDDDNLLPGFDDIEEDNDANDILPGFEDVDNNVDDDNMLPGFDDVEDEQEDDILPGFEDDEEDDEDELEMLPGFSNSTREEIDSVKATPQTSVSHTEGYVSNNKLNQIRKEPKKEYIDIDIERLITPNNKIATFVGSSKNGTSFIVSNIAEYLSDAGIDTAILDATQNKNSYYIYTKNEDELRSRAAYSITNLLNGNAKGIKVNQNLTVYTTVPNQEDNLENYGKILETLVKNHSVILIDCDFYTPYGYFENAQEIYLVQSMDILTIQPLTAFLRELKSRNILSDEKLKIIINKYVRLRKIDSKNIVGGMAFYNDPEMSFMTELFNRDKVEYQEVPFDEDIYVKYLDGIVDCDISIKKYSKDFMMVLRNLVNMVYPLLPPTTKNSGYSGYNYNKKAKTQYSNGFSSSVNNTLNNMKKNY